MKNTHQIYRERRSALLAADARAQPAAASRSCRPRPKSRATAIRSYPYRHDSYFYYLSGFPGARGGRRAGRRARTATGTCCSAARRTRSARSGTASATVPTRRARSSASTRRIRSRELDDDAARPRVRPARRCSRRSACSTAWDRQVTDAAERGAQPRAHRRRRARRNRRRARQRSTRCASSRTSTSSTLMRRAGAISRGAHRRAMERTRPGWYEYQVEAELAARVPAPRRAGGRLSVDRRRRAPTPACCTTATTTAQMQRRRAAADRRRLRIPGLRVGHHAHVPGRAASSPGRRRTSTSSCSRRSSRASTR